MDQLESEMNYENTDDVVILERTKEPKKPGLLGRLFNFLLCWVFVYLYKKKQK